MNEKQRTNVSKYLYSISQITFAGVVLGQIIKPDEFRVFTFVVGLTATVVSFIVAYLLDGGNKK